MTTRICFVTGHEFGRAALLGLLESPAAKSGDLAVVRLISLAREKASRTVGFLDLGPCADAYGLDHCVVPTSKNEAFAGLVAEARPDFLLIIGWSELVAPAVLDVPRICNRGESRHSSSYGSIGMHPSLLPTGRGRAPIPWTILRAENVTGLTAFLLEPEPDSGGIVLQREIRVPPTENATNLFARFVFLHYLVAAELAPLLATRTMSWRAQDSTRATYWSKRTPADSRIPFMAQTATEIERLVRAQGDPYPNAYFEHGGAHVPVKRAVVEPCLDSPAPGLIREVTHSTIVVGARIGAVRLHIEADTEIKFGVGESIE
jgi:methionyl-tRNA formyltransferase